MPDGSGDYMGTTNEVPLWKPLRLLAKSKHHTNDRTKNPGMTRVVDPDKLCMDIPLAAFH